MQIIQLLFILSIFTINSTTAQITFSYDSSGSMLQSASSDPTATNECYTLRVSISGHIYTPNDTPVQNVAVTLVENSNATTVYSNASGYYEFTDLVAGLDYTLSLDKNTNAANGVTMQDFSETKAHILENNLFTTPYQRIAGNVDNSNQLTLKDVILIEMVASGNVSNFPDVSSWQFVPSDYVFPNPGMPFGFPSTKNFTSLSQDWTGQDFIGIKMGDVDGSASGN